MISYIENDYIDDSLILDIAESTNDNGNIIHREYNNNVNIYYTIQNNILHIIYIISQNEHNGNATEALKNFIDEFNEYIIYLEALFYLESWYLKFGFKTKYDIEDMYCIRMERNCND